MDQGQEYIRRILKVLTYMERHIDEEMTMDQFAQVACYSTFHFQHLFRAIVGETVHQYVRRLRMERAAGQLRYTERSVTEIALDSNYDTPSAFTKAFKQSMGNSPRDYRREHSAVTMMKKRWKELPMIKPDEIKKMEDLDLLYIRRTGSYDTTPREAWEAMREYTEAIGIDKNKMRSFGVVHDNPQITSEEKLRYDACILATPGMKEKGEVARQVYKGGKVAIFTHRGSYEGLDNCFDAIFLKWLPASGESYDSTRAPLCEYLNLEYIESDPSQLVTKLYIPLV